MATKGDGLIDLSSRDELGWWWRCAREPRAVDAGTRGLGRPARLDPEAGLAPTLQQVMLEAKQLFEADAAGLMLIDGDGDGPRGADAQAAFERLRRAARSSSRRLVDVAREVTAGTPLPPANRSQRRPRSLGQAGQQETQPGSDS